jgi:hypothetical protein
MGDETRVGETRAGVVSINNLNAWLGPGKDIPGVAYPLLNARSA